MNLLNSSKRNQSGFTLLELLIVVAILALVTIIAIPNISSTFRFSVKSAAREIATLVKETSNSAQISGRIHRIVYDLKKNQYWVESTSETALLQSAESRKVEEDRRSIFDDKKDEESDKKGFRQESLVTRNKRTLPIGVQFKDVVTEQSEEPIIEGLAYTHVFPQGLSEKTLVHLVDTSKNEVSLIISNLLARCSVEGRYIEAKEVFQTP